MSQIPPSSQPLGSNSRIVLCRCSSPTPAQRLVSHTEKNPNRAFHRCRAQACGFFKWEDEIPANMWTTPPETPTQASQGQPYAVPPSTSSYPAKRSSSMLDGEGDAYGMNGSQKRFKSNGNAGPGYNNDYRQSPSQAPGSSQTTVTANGGWIRTASSQSTGGYGTQDSLDEDEWDFVAPPPPTHQTLAPSPFPLTPPPNAGPSRSTNSRYLPSSTTSPAFPPLSQIGIGVDSGFPPSTQSAEFTLSEIDDMIKSTLEHADDLEEQANQMRLHAKQLEGLKAYLEKVERKRKASEKSVEFKVGYIARLKEEIER